jgi:hypothetical protein
VLIVQAAWAWDRGRRLRRTRKKNTVSCGSSTGSEATKSIFIVERGGIDRKKENKRYQLDSSKKQYRDRKKQKKQASGTSGG